MDGVGRRAAGDREWLGRESTLTRQTTRATMTRPAEVAIRANWSAREPSSDGRWQSVEASGGEIEDDSGGSAMTMGSMSVRFQVAR